MQNEELKQHFNAIARNNDSKAFERVFRLTYDQLFLFAQQTLGNNTSAEDVVSETFLSVWKTRGRLEDVKTPRQYLFKIVRNKCLDELKKAHRKHTITLDNKYVEEITEKDLMDFEMKEKKLVLLANVIDQLPEKSRSVFKAVKLNGKSYAEVATTFGLSKKSIEYHMMKAIRIVREKFNNSI